jgi:hypothetical protein
MTTAAKASSIFGSQRGPFDFAQGRLWKGRSSTSPPAAILAVSAGRRVSPSAPPEALTVGAGSTWDSYGSPTDLK